MCVLEEKQSDWMTQREAQEHLRVSYHTLWRRLIRLKDNPRRIPGKVRFMALDLGGVKCPPRLVRADVYAMLPSSCDELMDGVTEDNQP